MARDIKFTLRASNKSRRSLRTIKSYQISQYRGFNLKNQNFESPLLIKINKYFENFLDNLGRKVMGGGRGEFVNFEGTFSFSGIYKRLRLSFGVNI